MIADGWDGCDTGNNNTALSRVSSRSITSSNSPSSAARRRDSANMPHELVGTGIENEEAMDEPDDEEKLF